MAKRKVKNIEPSVKYECNICCDKKVIERNGTMQKCICVIQQELKDYLGAFNPNLTINKNTTTNNTDRDILFEGISLNIFMSRAKSFMFKKYFQNKPLYYLMSVTDYTGYYVVGEADDISLVDYLFLTVGRDNYNQSQLTTISTLLNQRQMNGLPTWVYIYPNTTKSKLVEYYGKGFYELMYESKTFKRITK